MKPECKDAVEDLIEQVEGAGYRDRIGHPLENNVAFKKAKAVAGKDVRSIEPQSFENGESREDAPRH